MIRSHGGIFGRNPAFQNVEVQGDLAVTGPTVTFGINNEITTSVSLYKNPADNPPPFFQTTNNVPLRIITPETADYPTVGSSGLPGNVMMQLIDSTSGSTNFALLDSGDIQCANISMTGYLAPSDLYVNGKGWFNQLPNSSLADGPCIKIIIPSYGDPGDWITVVDENETSLVSIDAQGYASFNRGALITDATFTNSIRIQGIQQGRVTLTTTSTAQNTTLQWSDTNPSFKFAIQARNTTSGRFQFTEIVATKNTGSTIASTTLFDINVGGVAATYALDLVGGYWRLKITPSLATSTSFSVFYTGMV